MQNRTPLTIVFLVVLAALAGYAVCRKPDEGITTVAPITPDASGESVVAEPARPPVDEPEIDPALQTVIDELIARWDELDIVSASLTTHLPEAAGSRGNTIGQGKYDYIKTDDGIRIWYWMFNNLAFFPDPEDRGAATKLTAENLISVYDGEFLYQEVGQLEFKKTVKTTYHPDKILQIGGSDLFRRLLELNTLKLIGEETYNEMQTYVIEATPKEGDWTETYWFDKETGIRVRIIQPGETEVPALTFEVTEIDLDPQFDDDHFIYKLKGTYELIDQTQAAP